MRVVSIGFGILTAIFGIGFAPVGSFRTDLDGRSIALDERSVQHKAQQNGYEFYLRAAKVLSNSETRNYDQLITYNQSLAAREGQATPAMPPAPPLPPGLSYESTRLDILRAKHRRFGGALDLVAKGNGFPTTYPRQELSLLDPALDFPQLASLRNLAKFASESVYVLMADGNSRGATTVLINTLTMARRVQCSSAIAMMTGGSCEAVMLAAVHAHLDRFAIEDVRRLGRYADSTLAAADPVFVTLEFERLSLRQTLSNVVLNPGKIEADADRFFSGLGLGEFQELLKGIQEKETAEFDFRSIPLARRQAIVDRLHRRVDDVYRSARVMFRRPDRDWVPLTKSKSEESSEEVEHKVPANLEEAVGQLEETILVSASFIPGLGQNVALRRAQMRLLRLHAWVLERRWLDGKLPGDLKGAGDWALDPLSGASFEYEVSGTNRYRLFSKGHGTLGVIELLYQRPKMPMPPESIDPVPPR